MSGPGKNVLEESGGLCVVIGSWRAFFLSLWYNPHREGGDVKMARFVRLVAIALAVAPFIRMGIALAAGCGGSE